MQKPSSSHALKPLNTRTILDAALDGQALTATEALHLLQLTEQEDLHRLQEAANERRTQQVGDTVYYTTGASLYFTNLCELEPVLYPYPHKPGDDHTYTLTIDDIDACLEEASRQQLQRLSLSAGGYWPYLQIPGLETPNILKTYARLVSYVREKVPTIYIAGFSPDEVDFLAVLSDRTETYILEMLMDQGLQSLGSNAVGILADPVRQALSSKLATVKRWLEITTSAARLELPITANIETGPLETLAERIQHLGHLKTFQHRHLNAFLSMQPHMWSRLPVKPVRTMPGLPHCTHIDRLKLTAVMRLWLGENIPDQAVFWQPNAETEVQEALQWGANSLGSTDILSYRAFLSGSRAADRFSESEFQRLITETGRTPAQLQLIPTS